MPSSSNSSSSSSALIPSPRSPEPTDSALTTPTPTPIQATAHVLKSSRSSYFSHRCSVGLAFPQPAPPPHTLAPHPGPPPPSAPGSGTASTAPNSERRDPFKKLIRPFFRRGHTNPIGSLKETLKLSMTKNHTQPDPLRGSGPTGSFTGSSRHHHKQSRPINDHHHYSTSPSVNSSSKPKRPSSEGCSSNTRSSLLGAATDHIKRRSGGTYPLHSTTPSSDGHQQQQPQLPPIPPRSLPPLPSAYTDDRPTKNSPDTSHPTPQLSLPDAIDAQAPVNHRLSISPSSSPQPSQLYPHHQIIEPAALSPLGSHFPSPSPSKSSPSIVTLTTSIHSLLTQPALVTLAQLAPAQLLSGVHSTCFGSSDSFRAFEQTDLSEDLPSSTAGLLGQPVQAAPGAANDHKSQTGAGKIRRLPTTIEQLSASSIALPITSISSIWRLLNCIEWINLKEHELHTHPVSARRLNSYSSHSSCRPVSSDMADDRQPVDELGSFDLANTLQHVGDILSAISSESDVELVFYHIFYPPKLEVAELNLLHSEPSESDRLYDSLYLPSDYTEQPGSKSASPPSLVDRDVEPSANAFLGAGADGEGGLREISVKADEKGLIIGLTCLLRQILYRAKRRSTIEVGLHLTPLYKNQLPKSSQSGGALTKAGEAPGQDTRTEDFPTGEDAPPSSWKCIFDVSLMAPNPLKSKPPNDQTDLETLGNSTQKPSSGTLAGDRSSIGAEIRALATSARLRMSSNLTSELPLCPEDSLSKMIFEKLLGMRLTTGRLTSSGHSWKVTGIFEKGPDREADDGINQPSKNPISSQQLASQGSMGSIVPSREPTADELTHFAETTLKGKKAVFFAAEQSIFAEHITTYLTSWNMDVSHMPYVGTEEEEKRSVRTKGTVSARSSMCPESSVNGSAGGQGTSSKLLSSESNQGQLKSIRSNNFIIIDDDMATLKVQLARLKNSPPSSIHLPTNLLQTKHQQQQSQRPALSRRIQSSSQLDRFEGTSKQPVTSIIHFTSVSNFRKVQEIIRIHLMGTQWTSIPDVLVIPKPIGPRRILTALHTAISRPLTEPQFMPIATSPSSPGTPHHLNPVATQPLGTSQLGRLSPALAHLGAGMDFETAAANHLKNELAMGATPADETTPTNGPPPSVQSSTPPGLRTPGTAPGTPGYPSPALLSSEALEYFSKAASENGGSPSTGVVLQSPDGRPQAMFFHHSLSSSRSNLGNSHLQSTTQNYFHSIHPAISSPGGALGRTGSLKQMKNEMRTSLSQSISRDLATLELDGDSFTATPKAPTTSNVPQVDESSITSTDLCPRTCSVKPRKEYSSLVMGSSTKSPSILGSSSAADSSFPHAMALDQFEAISPKTPTVSFGPEGFYSSQASRLAMTPTNPSTTATTSSASQEGSSVGTAQNQERPTSGNQSTSRESVVAKPTPMLRMPSVSANLPTNITACLPSNRRSPAIQFNPPTAAPVLVKPRIQNSPPILASRMTTTGEVTLKKEGLNQTSGVNSLVRSTSMTASAIQTKRRASMGDTMSLSGRFARKKVSRKPATTLVPPINVLIVEDNRINQTILATFMRKKSVKFDVAMNGQEAVDKWRTGSFHLVLMDLQLPVKDGIEATKEIREAERALNINAFANTPPAAGGNTPPGLVGNHVPNVRPIPNNVSVIIVALTASSLDVDREVALAAGCNDFLTKPVSLAWLEKKLLEWGSMAWLSGFSRPTLGVTRTGGLSQSMGPIPVTMIHERKPMSFTGTVAERKAKDVAEHLYLKVNGKNRHANETSREGVEQEEEEEEELKEERSIVINEIDPETKAGPEKLPEEDEEEEEGVRIKLQVPTPERMGIGIKEGIPRPIEPESFILGSSGNSQHGSNQSFSSVSCSSGENSS